MSDIKYQQNYIMMDLKEIVIDMINLKGVGRV